MSASAAAAERGVDLPRWRRALVSLWWLPVSGLVIGAVIGALYSFTGSTTYKAAALISLGQPTSPGGSLVQGFGSNPRAVQQIVSSADAQAQATAQAGLGSSALRGRVSVAEVGTAATAGRATPLISLAVTGSNQRKTEDAANALARIVVQKTTADYVGTKIRTYTTTLRSVNEQLGSVKDRIAVIDKAIAASKNLDPLQRLVIVSQEDNAETRLGNLISQQEILQQQLAFATQIESAQIVDRARAVKAAAHSRKTSVVIGALIGLIVGAVVAIAGESRFRRA
jgi:uncharacterized protein involved in exopolysaccharide biosynthesis